MSRNVWAAVFLLVIFISVAVAIDILRGAVTQ
jgi:hypothetical protein